MPIDTSKRSEAAEMMDDFAMEGEILRDALDKLASINKLLGGNSVTIDGVKKLLNGTDKNRRIRIVDIGCGNGDMLRILADFAKQKQLNFELIGVDANQFTINHAKQLSVNYQNISYQCEDIFKDEIANCDIILCTLTLHHFKDQEIIDLLTRFKKAASLGMVINDLQRSALAYYLFIGLCFVFGLNHMSKEDGLVSILRGFKKHDLQLYSKQSQLKNCSIKWKWAFRYQWIIKTA
ncbi:MAG: methyltransferase domain-containing protein [Flavobacterium sp.]|nr:MAG: methyltransferase domain-containing protein [Flavobacterium sp.]